MIRVSFWTAVFLVALRLCIGWHFAYEGYGKVKSAYLGKAAVNEKPDWVLLKVKRKAPGAGNASADLDDEVTVAERAAELQKKSAEVKAAYGKLELMGKDVEGPNLRTLKTDVNAIRAELQKEIDDQ